MISTGIRNILRSNSDDTGKEKLWALRDISFELEYGKSLALVGANGAGKTTLLKLIANITRPTSGKLESNGRISALIELGAGFHPELTGRENIFLNGQILGLGKRDISGRLDQIIDFSGLEQFIDTPIKRYSSGMVIRLGFAVAAFVEPDILLVDEVLAVGDAQFRHKCMQRVKSMIQQGTSMIFVSHNLWLVQAVCDRAIFIDHGVMKKIGETEAVLRDYERHIHEMRSAESRHENPLTGENSKDIEITNIAIVDEDGLEKDEFRNDSPVQLQIQYKRYASLEEVILAIRVIRSDGLTCCLMRSNVDGFPIDLRNDTGTIVVTLNPIQLYGGQYYVHTVFRDVDDTYGMATATSRFFYVHGSPLSHQEMNGVFVPNTVWRQLSE